jgi:hypothetical protein
VTGPLASVRPVGEKYATRRRIADHKVDHAHDVAELLREHGAITGERIYDRRHQAEWQARWLRDLLVDCHLFAAPELVQHTAKKYGGWIWSLEYKEGSYGR